MTYPTRFPKLIKKIIIERVQKKTYININRIHLSVYSKSYLVSSKSYSLIAFLNAVSK